MKRVVVFFLAFVLMLAGIYSWKEKEINKFIKKIFPEKKENEVTVLSQNELKNDNQEFTNDVDQNTEQMSKYLIINSEPFTISIKDGFDNAGFSKYICDGTDVYEFKSVPNENEVQWSIYVLDEEFGDGDRYLSQVYTPALVGDGKLNIEDGKYIYVYCSINGFTGEGNIPENESYLEIRRSGM